MFSLVWLYSFLNLSLVAWQLLRAKKLSPRLKAHKRLYLHCFFVRIKQTGETALISEL